MTFTRLIAVICLCSFLLPHLEGQQQAPPDNKPPLIEALSADSAGAKLTVPNMFSPNGDQINDYFEVKTDGTTVYEFSVFTRTGTRIFHSMSPRIFWDGNSLDGNKLSEGVYYYVIEEQGGNTPFKAAGFIYLFR